MNRFRRVKKKDVFYKTPEEIALIKRNGDILGRCHAHIARSVRPGVSILTLNRMAESFIRDHGAIPSFLGYNGFPTALCTSVNETVVHGIPDNYKLRNGDIISIDCGVFKDNLHADSAYTYTVGKVKPSVLTLLKKTKECLFLGIDQAKKNNRVGNISFAIQKHAEQHGYSVVRELTGHGVGRFLHENPEVPNYGRRQDGITLKNNLVLAIEPMINLGKKRVFTEKDGWTVRAADRKPSAHFEHTIAIKDNKPQILTTFKYIEAVLAKQGKLI